MALPQTQTCMTRPCLTVGSSLLNALSQEKPRRAWAYQAGLEVVELSLPAHAALLFSGPCGAKTCQGGFGTDGLQHHI
jgi:hypothetical protein